MQFYTDRASAEFFNLSRDRFRIGMGPAKSRPSIGDNTYWHRDHYRTGTITRRQTQPRLPAKGR